MNAGFSVPLRWNAGLDVSGTKRLAELIAVVALVGNQRVGGRQAWIEQFRPRMVAHLALGQQHDERFAVAVTYDMELGVQPTLGASDTARNIPFLSRLAAVRWAFR